MKKFYFLITLQLIFAFFNLSANDFVVDYKTPIESLSSGVKVENFIYSLCGNSIVKLNIADSTYSDIVVLDTEMFMVDHNSIMLNNDNNIMFGTRDEYFQHSNYWILINDVPVKTGIPVPSNPVQNSQRDIIGFWDNTLILKIHNDLLDTIYDLNKDRPGYAINSLIIDKSDGVWFSCVQNQDTALNDKNYSLFGKLIGDKAVFWNESNGLPKNPEKLNPILSIDQYGDAWYGIVNSGLCKISDGVLKSYSLTGMKNPDGSNIYFNKILFDNYQRAWLINENSNFTKYKFNVLDVTANTDEAFSENEYSKLSLAIYSTTVDRLGNIIAACDSGIVLRYSNNEWNYEQLFVKADSFGNFVKMPDGTMILGSDKHGLFYHDTHKWINYDPGQGYPVFNTIQFELSRTGEVWFPVLNKATLISPIYSDNGTRRKFYYGFDDNAKLVTTLFNKNNDPIFVTDYGLYYGADSSRLYRINDSLEHYRFFSGAVIDSNDHIWLNENIIQNGLTNSELYEFDGKDFKLHLSKKFQDYSPDKLFIGIPNVTVVDGNNTLWGAFSSESGKYLVKFDGEKWTKPSIPEPYPVSGNYLPLCISADDSMGIWVGFHNFISIASDIIDNVSTATYYHDGKSEIYTGFDLFKDLYPSGNIYDIAAMGYYVWFATDAGLLLLDKRDGSLTKFSYKEGMNAGTIFKLKMSRTGKLWVCGNNGFYTIFPKNLVDVKYNIQTKAQILIYPNPAKYTLNIEIPGDITADKITINDISGKELISFDRGKSTADLSSLPNGTYILGVLTHRGMLISKTLKIER